MFATTSKTMSAVLNMVGMNINQIN